MNPIGPRSVALWTVLGGIAAVVALIFTVGSGSGNGGKDDPNDDGSGSAPEVTLEDWAANVDHLCSGIDGNAYAELMSTMESGASQAEKIAAAKRVEAEHGEFVEDLQSVPLPTRSGPRSAASQIRMQAVDAANGIQEFVDYGIAAGEAGDFETANATWQKFSRNLNTSFGELAGLGAGACAQDWQ